MKYEIHYALTCNTGKVRGINQDNFWCIGKYLEEKNDGLKLIESGKINSASYPTFAVFDGMGGEQYGEVAAYIATKTFDSLCGDFRSPDIKNFLINACKQMNSNITNYAKQKYVECVGTTAAILMFGKKEIYACNIGDSKIYHYDNKKLTQISKDHIVDLFKNKKPPLSQFLGIPENEFIIEPYLTHKLYNDGDYFLLCSDGLTDMLTEDEIKNILSKNKDVKRCVDTLLEKALFNGGIDNITIILCKIVKQKRFFGII
jgi:protein phosphatase